jgi:tRNA threonylcarbamoyladenosine biosynthesis protein TsaB
VILLAIDSAGESCSAALWDTARPAGKALLGERVLGPARGQAERLISLVESVLADAGLSYDGLGALAVNHGPGSFTGLRSAVAAARGLALATGLGVVPVSSLEALVCGLRPGVEGLVLAALDARRGEVYVQRFGPDLSPQSQPRAMPQSQPRAMPPRQAVAGISGPVRLVGSGADLIQAVLPAGVTSVMEAVRLDARLVARCAARRLAAGEQPVTGFEVRPLYLRAPDARPPVPLVARARAEAAP